MKLRHDVGDGIANAGDFCERASRDDAVERLGKSRKAVCSAQVGLRTVGIAAAERRSLRIFPEGGGRRFECRFLPWLLRQTGAGPPVPAKSKDRPVVSAEAAIPFNLPLAHPGMTFLEA